MFVRSPMQRRYAGLAAMSAGLSAALLVTGCSNLPGHPQTAKDASQEVRLLGAAEPGPDPFTPSTVTVTAASGKNPAPHGSAAGTAPTTVRPIRAVLGSTPGLYGGTRSVASCDVEQQIRLLTADVAKGRAFTQGAGVSQEDIPSFLRGLTPVVLRADARVTSHGYRDGTAQRYQSVLQTGTAVLVDEHGSPRVRCASGSPLASPVVTAAEPDEKGTAWRGYDRDRVVVVTRATHVIDQLVIADIAGTGWLERRSGTDGEADRTPAVPPRYAPSTHVADVPGSQPGGPDTSGSRSANPNAVAPPAPSPDATRQGAPSTGPAPARPVPDVGGGGVVGPQSKGQGSTIPQPEGDQRPAPQPDAPLPDAPLPDAYRDYGPGPDTGAYPDYGPGFDYGVYPDGIDPDYGVYPNDGLGPDYGFGPDLGPDAGAYPDHGPYGGPHAVAPDAALPGGATGPEVAPSAGETIQG
ncbi:DUF6777 domain-containing protein [Streptomyces sp. NPDC059169]|uniref:DUF6777 domain-containing protein n=1 Tax=Streptomyces sp. NPDC059169 TaxID=3346754 RepID=UPI0036C3BE21